MIKSIIKEIIIILLLLVAVVLALGVLFYDYIPTNKIVPDVQDYTTSETVKQELSAELAEDEQVTLETYKITKEDLDTYGKNGEYNKGKANPFSTYEEEPPEDNDVTTSPVGSTTAGNSNTNESSNNNSNKGNTNAQGGNTVFTGKGTK